MRRRDFLRVASGATGATAAGAVAVPVAAAETVTVELVDFAFEPGTESPLTIPPGTTVRFVWETDSHNIVVESQPDDAEWAGHETIENSGFETEHTFDVEGEYDIFCQPHQGLGMEGTIVVTEDADSGGGNGGGNGGGDGGSTGPTMPDSAMTIGVITFAALGVTLGLAFALMKYGGEYKPE